LQHLTNEVLAQAPDLLVLDAGGRNDFDGLRNRDRDGKAGPENGEGESRVKLLKVGPYQTKREEAAKDGEHFLVWATSRDCPNKSSKARGRVLHIERVDDKFDCPATFCGMMAIEYADKDYPRIVCIQCQNIKAKETRSSSAGNVSDLEAQYFRRILDLEAERDRLRKANEELAKALKDIENGVIHWKATAE
jgi:hypothetical protein